MDGEEGVNAPLVGAELDDWGSVFIAGGEWDPLNGDTSEVSGTNASLPARYLGKEDQSPQWSQ